MTAPSAHHARSLDAPRGRVGSLRSRRRTAGWRCALGACAVLAAGGGIGCATIASHGDYEDYRAVRLSQDGSSARLRAGRTYLDRHPTGVWAETVRAEMNAAEQAFFEANAGSITGLQRYLTLYPDGTQAESARARMSAMTEARRREAAADEAQRAEARAVREAALLRRRQWATRSVGFWTGVLGSVSRWDQTIEAVATTNTVFNDAMADAPRPRCDASDCTKRYRIGYSVRIPGGTRVEREVVIVVRLRFDDGVLVSGSVLMPGFGFSRWHELETGQLVTDFDEQARADAIAWALARIRPMLDETLAEGESFVAQPDVIVDPIARPHASAEAAAGAGAAHDEVYPTLVTALDSPRARVVVFAASIDDEGEGYDGVRFEARPPSPPTSP